MAHFHFSTSVIADIGPISYVIPNGSYFHRSLPRSLITLVFYLHNYSRQDFILILLRCYADHWIPPIHRKTPSWVERKNGMKRDENIIPCWNNKSTKYFYLQSRGPLEGKTATLQMAKIIYLDDFIVGLEFNFQSGFLFTSVPATLWPAGSIVRPVFSSRWTSFGLSSWVA